MNERAIQQLAYKRYGKFVRIDSDKKATVDQVVDILPFCLSYVNNISYDSMEEIITILSTEITKERTKKTFMVFNDVYNSDRQALLIQQIIHYASTYGAGLQGTDAYIPNDEFDKKVVENLIVIDTISYSEFMDRLVEDIYTTLQWTQEEISLIAGVFDDANIELLDISEIVSKELKLVMCSKFDYVPEDVNELFRLMWFKVSSGNSLLVKNKETIDIFKEYSNQLEYLLTKYIKIYGIISLAENFNRYKKLFLSLKNDKTRKLINRISKLSKKYHKPVGIPDYLLITEKISKSDITMSEFKKLIKNMDTSYLIKLGNALSYRAYAAKKGISVFIYKVRNGKVFTKKSKIGNAAEWELYLNITKRTIKTKLLDSMYKKNTFIDLDVCANYGLPVSGKQFLGEVPFGTKISDFNVLGVYWRNIEEDGYSYSVDLDLSLTNPKSKIGWNSQWRDTSAIYSGDMTDAKDGASESFFFKKDNKETYLLNLNLFSIDYGTDITSVPYTLWAGSIYRASDVPKTAMVDNFVFSLKDVINKANRHRVLGVVTDGSFYVGDIVMPSRNVAGVTPHELLEAFKCYVKSRLTFGDVISKNDFIEQPQTVSQPTKDILLKIVS